MGDTQKRADLVAVLAEYADVTEVESSEDAIEFFLQGKRIQYRYDQENLNARAALRDKLYELGAVPKSTANDTANDAEPEPAVAPAPQPAGRPVSPDEGYSIFQSSHVIAIELSQDLMISKGSVLIIPLHRPNTFIDMPSEQFHLLFDKTDLVMTPMVETEAPPPPARRPFASSEDSEDLTDDIVSRPNPSPQRFRSQTDIDDIIAYLQARNGAVKTNIIADALGRTIKSVDGHLRDLRDQGVVVAQSGFWTLASKGPPTARPAPTGTTTATTTTTTTATTTATGLGRSRLGVSPQVGRILAAMAYVSKLTGKTDLTTSDVVKYLDERDGKQYSARIPGMLRDGFVQQGLPLQTRGWHHRITTKGLTIIKELGPWPYEYDQQPAPEWLAHL